MSDPTPEFPCEMEHGEWRLVTRDLRRRVDPYSVVRAIPGHKSYRFWRSDDDRFIIAVGAALKVSRAPIRDGSASISRLLNELRAVIPSEFTRSDTGLRAFLSVAFDPTNAFDAEVWRGYAPVELYVPDILIRIDDSGTRLTSFAQKERFQTLEKTAAALVEERPGDLDRKEPCALHTDDASYEAVVQETLRRIDSAEVSKVVVAREGIARRSSGYVPADVLQRLGEQFPSCFLFGVRPGGSHRGPAPAFVGATPERLVRVDGENLVTGALAGSAPRGVSANIDERNAQELLRSDKERREHEFVTEMIERSVAPLSGQVSRGDTVVKRLANVQHLYTPITARLNEGVGILEAVDQLHPTPAVCGEPAGVARSIIREVEGFKRGLYAGALGWIDLDSGSGEVAVAIRSALLDGEVARLFAGAGIVAGSDPAHEARETRIKFDAVLHSL